MLPVVRLGEGRRERWFLNASVYGDDLGQTESNATHSGLASNASAQSQWPGMIEMKCVN